jgi:hypothetical protein
MIMAIDSEKVLNLALADCGEPGQPHPCGRGSVAFDTSQVKIPQPDAVFR